MRKLCLLFLATGSLLMAPENPNAATATAPRPGLMEKSPETTEATFVRLADEWMEAYNGKDAPRVAALYTEDAYYISAHVMARGQREIQAYFQRGMDARGHVDSIRLVKVETESDLGYAIGIYEATNNGEKVDGRIVMVLKKVEGRWRFAVHETVVRDQP